jgi:hypothetical protein
MEHRASPDSLYRVVRAGGERIAEKKKRADRRSGILWREQPEIGSGKENDCGLSCDWQLCDDFLLQHPLGYAPPGRGAPPLDLFKSSKSGSLWTGSRL